ncbi:MAG: crossover junction endodeoxyribonuclease RuvC, partial [Selenomonadaceae bacterium]|nr:crossover junction endodeoxyribonuclease RuvC [Selenomonadaceae bacterium]
MSLGMFGKGRRRLTLFYSCIMCVFLVVLIFGVHRSMEWAISSEQARELIDTATNISEAQTHFNQHPEIPFDDNNIYKSSNDRLFFYIFDDTGRLVNFSRASFRIEPFILDVIASRDVLEGDVSVYGKPDEKGRSIKVMMTSCRVYNTAGIPETVYVGKDVTAMYNGMQKATYALMFLGVLALIIATAVGHVMSGKALVPLREAYEKQRQFAADASHELRTPLAVVLASAELLENDPSIKSPFLKQVISDVRDEVKKMTKLVSDLLVVARSDNQALKLKKIFERVLEIINEYHPDELAIEAPFFGKNVQSMLKLGRAQGVAMAAALYRDIPIFEYSPKTIKQNITGNGNASKEQVAKMVHFILKTEENPQFFDATDAVAAAVCHSISKGKDVNYTKHTTEKATAHRKPDWTKFIA